MRKTARRAFARLLAAGYLCLSLGCDIRDESPRPSRPNPLLGAPAATPGGGAAPAIEYVGGYEAGRQRAAAEERPLLVVCTAGWCRFSAEMTRRTLHSPRLVEVTRRAVCVWLDADRDAAECRDLRVKAFPTLLVLDTAGTERFRATGNAAPEVLAAALATALAPSRLATAPGVEPPGR